MASLNKGQWLHFVSLLCLFVWPAPGESLPLLPRMSLHNHCLFYATAFSLRFVFISSHFFFFYFLISLRMWSIDKDVTLATVSFVSFPASFCKSKSIFCSAGGRQGERGWCDIDFLADMIIKHVECQIKAGLMKDRHQSATSLERL